MAKCPIRQRLIFPLVLLLATVAAFCADNPPLAGQGHKIFQWRSFLAPFHAVVLHFPIGFITVVFILEIYRKFRPSEEVGRLSVLMLWLSLVSGMVAASFGWLRAQGGGYDTQMLQRHLCCGVLVLSFTAITLATQCWARHRPGSSVALAGYRLLLSITMALLVIAGHFGGNLTHGSRYLTENAPQFVRDLLDEESAVPAAPSSQGDDRSRFFTEKIQPIFSSKCYACHGPEKQKGGYRLDLPAHALKGGHSGKPAIKPQNPLESRLVQLILLPPEHEDVMPPSGKQPLSTEEVALLLQWIRDGAVFPGTSPAAALGINLSVAR